MQPFASTNQENVEKHESPGRSNSVPSRKQTGTPTSSENRSRSSSSMLHKLESGTAI